MRVLFLVPLLGLTFGPRTVVSNTITSYTVAEVEEDTGATDATGLIQRGRPAL